MHEARFNGLDMNMYLEKGGNGKTGEQNPSKRKVCFWIEFLRFVFSSVLHLMVGLGTCSDAFMSLVKCIQR